MAKKEPIPNSWEEPAHIPENPTYDTPLVLIGLPPKLYALLSDAGYKTLGRLMHVYNSNPDALVQISGVGPAALETIHTALSPFISLNHEESPLPLPAPGLPDDGDWTRLPTDSDAPTETAPFITPPPEYKFPPEETMTLEPTPEDFEPTLEPTVEDPGTDPIPEDFPEPTQETPADSVSDFAPVEPALPETEELAYEFPPPDDTLVPIDEEPEVGFEDIDEPELPAIEIPVPVGVPPTPETEKEPKKKKKKPKKKKRKEKKKKKKKAKVKKKLKKKKKDKQGKKPKKK